MLHRTVKIPDSADGLGFQIRGFGPSVVHAVGRGKRETDRKEKRKIEFGYRKMLIPFILLSF